MTTTRKVHNWMCELRPSVLLALVIGLIFNSNVIARDANPPAPQELAIVGARMYPSPDAAPVEDSVVVMRDGRIVRVGARSIAPVAAGGRLTDTQGAVRTAGFWNSHIH